MQAPNEPALSAASGKRALSSDALAMSKSRQTGQSLPAVRIGQFTRAHSTGSLDS